MTTNIFYKAIIFLAASLACLSCSQDMADDVVSTDSEGTVRIVYKIDGATATRATEGGWTDWNENKIKSLFLILFYENGQTAASWYTYAGIDSETSFEGVDDASTMQTMLIKNDYYGEINYDNLAANGNNYTYYLAANFSIETIIVGDGPPILDPKTYVLESILNLGDGINGLKSSYIEDDLSYNAKQDAFSMDAKGTIEIDEANKMITLTFSLKRAAAKIRVAVQDADKKSIIPDCQMKLCNYVVPKTSYFEEGEKYGDGSCEKLNYETGKYETVYPQQRGTSENFLSYPGGTSTSTDVFLTKDNKAVFYTYPNDWFDESKLSGGSLGTNYASDDLVVEDKQTYILLKAPYNGTDYYYKVPVNYLIDKDNDKSSFTADEIKDIRNNYYRILRNHIYDVTVTIDRAGGPITAPVTPTFQVDINNWKEGGSYEIEQSEFN